MKKVKSTYQESKVAGRAVVDKVKSLIHQGNIRRIIIKDNRGRLSGNSFDGGHGRNAGGADSGCGRRVGGLGFASFTFGVEKVRGAKKKPAAGGKKKPKRRT